MSICIYGKNPARENVRSGSAISLKVNPRNAKDPIVSEAKVNHIPVEIVSDAELTKLAKTAAHQGFVTVCKDYKTVDLEDIIEGAKQKKYPLVVMLDGIEDPHNLGAILRTCDAFGVDGLIVKTHGQAPLNATVAKVSTGAINYVKVASVSNLSNAIKELQNNGYWVVATAGEAKQGYEEVDYACPICLVIGNEGFGVSRLVKERSDFLVKIDMVGHVDSLNASVATGVMVSHIFSSRKGK